MSDYETLLVTQLRSLHLHMPARDVRCVKQKEKLTSISLADADCDENSRALPDSINSLAVPGW